MKKEIENLEKKQANVIEVYEKINEVLSRNKGLRRKPVYYSPLHQYIINLHKYTKAKKRQQYSCSNFITASENAISALENGEWNEEIVKAEST